MKVDPPAGTRAGWGWGGHHSPTLFCQPLCCRLTPPPPPPLDCISCTQQGQAWGVNRLFQEQSISVYLCISVASLQRSSHQSFVTLFTETWETFSSITGASLSLRKLSNCCRQSARRNSYMRKRRQFVQIWMCCAFSAQFHRLLWEISHQTTNRFCVLLFLVLLDVWGGTFSNLQEDFFLFINRTQTLG